MLTGRRVQAIAAVQSIRITEVGSGSNASRNRRARRVSCTTHNCRSCRSAETFRPVPRTDSCTAAIYSETSPARTSNVGATAALQFGILASRSCSSIARRSLVRLISARECARSRLVSATTAFRRSISRRVSETREREDTGPSSTDSAHCTATRCASPRLPNAQGLIQGSTADGTSDRNRSSMGTTGHLSLYRSLNACRMFSLRAVPNLVQLARRELQAGCRLRADHSVSNPDLGAVVSPVDEGAKLVDREEVLDAITELLGHVPGVVGERLGRVARLPTPVLDL